MKKIEKIVRHETENESQFIWRIGKMVDSGEIDSWKTAADIINKEFRDEDSQYTEASYRKPYQSAKKFYEAGVFESYSDSGSYAKELEEKALSLRKERIKLQTANVERNRIDRNLSRQELYFEQLKDMIGALPVPEFSPLFSGWEKDISYLCCISDIHYGAKFDSESNSYSPDVVKERLECLCGELERFVAEKKIEKIHIACLGDTIQGILRTSDLKLNDTSVVKSVVEVSRLLALFLNEVSRFVTVEYYHVPSANHTQIRPLGTKANELADEDLEYVIGHYIEDLCSNNARISVHLAENNDNGVFIDIPGFEVFSMHGHQIKNIGSALSELTLKKKKFIDYLIVGHSHSGKAISVSENCTYDSEILVCPSFIGSDPYSDSLFKGSKAAVNIFGFDRIYGQTETYKIILN